MRKKILISIILYFFLFSNIVSYAATPAEVGKYVASNAKNFCEKYTIIYDYNAAEFGSFSRKYIYI